MPTVLLKFIVINFIFFILSAVSFATPLSVMTFNIENGGTGVNFNKVTEAIKKADADVVGIQEAWGHTERLAKSLGWKYYDNQQHILSRFPLFEIAKHKNNFVLIEVEPGKFVAMANMHLPDEPYGPDLIKNNSSAATVLANERKVRLPTALPFITKITSLAHAGIPVFLTGDFNSPSDLDWTAATVNLLRNHRYALAWPVTKTAEANGLIDSYRKIHPDAVKMPSYTWPSGRPFIKNAIDGFNPTAKDLTDRIDFIFTAGPSKVIASEIVGESQNPNIKISVSPWPSDHRAVVSRFEVTPASYSLKNLIAEPLQSNHEKNPVIFTSKKTFHSGEEIKISWNNAPSEGYDYITIYPISSNKTTIENAVRLYTHGEKEGSLKYNALNAKGNWQAWEKSDAAHWPLTPGKYAVRLVLDDSYTVVASTEIKIV